MYIIYNLIIFTIFLLCFTIFLRINNKFNYYFTILLPSFTRFLLGFTRFLLYSFSIRPNCFRLKNIYIYLLCFTMFLLFNRSFWDPKRKTLLRNYYFFNVYLLHLLLFFTMFSLCFHYFFFDIYYVLL